MYFCFCHALLYISFSICAVIFFAVRRLPRSFRSIDKNFTCVIFFLSQHFSWVKKTCWPCRIYIRMNKYICGLPFGWFHEENSNHWYSNWIPFSTKTTSMFHMWILPKEIEKCDKIQLDWNVDCHWRWNSWTEYETCTFPQRQIPSSDYTQLEIVEHFRKQMKTRMHIMQTFTCMWARACTYHSIAWHK